MATAPALELPDVDPALLTTIQHRLGTQTIVDAGAGRRISILPAADLFGRYFPLHRDVAVLDAHGIVGDGELWHLTDDEARDVVASVLAGDLTEFGVDA